MKDMEYTFENDNGLSLTVTDESVENYSPVMGGMDTNPTWEEYLAEYKAEYQPHMQLIRKAVEELGWIGETGESISNYWCFVFSDGQAWGFSWRAWGDLMQAIVGKREGYMAYYM